MDAVKFIKIHGWKEAKSVCNGIFTGCVSYEWVQSNIDELRRYVEAYDLLDSNRINPYIETPFELEMQLQHATRLIEEVRK